MSKEIPGGAFAQADGYDAGIVAAALQWADLDPETITDPKASALCDALRPATKRPKDNYRSCAARVLASEVRRLTDAIETCGGIVENEYINDHDACRMVGDVVRRTMRRHNHKDNPTNVGYSSPAHENRQDERGAK